MRPKRKSFISVCWEDDNGGYHQKYFRTLRKSEKFYVNLKSKWKEYLVMYHAPKKQRVKNNAGWLVKFQGSEGKRS